MKEPPRLTRTLLAKSLSLTRSRRSYINFRRRVYNIPLRYLLFILGSVERKVSKGAAFEVPAGEIG